MPEVLELVLPRSLTTVGQGTVSFTVEIVGNAYRGWRRTCAVGTLENGRGFTFQPGGKAAVSIPGEFVGRALLVLRFVDPGTGRALVGDCSLEIRRWGDVNVRIEAGGHSAGEEGVVYQPIELGDTDTGALRVVDGEVHLPVVLEEEPLAGVWPLSAFLHRERLIRLPGPSHGEEGEVVDLLALHAGPSLVVGRCYASQLRPAARRRLADTGESKVHWVTRWDDDRISQLAARLSLAGGASPVLEVENLSDYSASRQPLDLVAGQHGVRGLGAGDSGGMGIDDGQILELAAGADGRRRQLVRFRFDDVRLGRVLCPVFRTERTVFPFPPDAEDGRRVRFLGVWVPLPTEDLARLLESVEVSLEILFPQAELRLSLALEARSGGLTVGSNEDLSHALH